MLSCSCKPKINDEEEGKILIVLMGINALMFLIECTLGIFSESTALISDSLDMLADATVYGIALYAVGKPALFKVKAAHMSGLFQITLGSLVAADAVRRLVFGSEPESILMISVGMLALIANLISLQIISKHKEGEIHMRASWVFSKNDVLANLGIIVGGILVSVFHSRYPDIIIGLLISGIVIRGGIQILNDASKEKQILTKINN
jgi:Co/Zn/Cd efflux system component